jgi:LPS-assembly lipoprotein
MTRDYDRRRFVKGLCLALAIPLSGCGFQPVYMPTASGDAGPAARELATVNVPVIGERPGQILRQALQERFHNDSGTPAAYDLRVYYSISGEGLAVQTNNIATRIRLTGNAYWTLLARDPSQTPLTSGRARSLDGLNQFNAQYFGSDLETEAVQQRIAQSLADQITSQLAVWFRQRANHEAANSSG